MAADEELERFRRDALEAERGDYGAESYDALADFLAKTWQDGGRGPGFVIDSIGDETGVAAGYLAIRVYEQIAALEGMPTSVGAGAVEFLEKLGEALAGGRG